MQAVEALREVKKAEAEVQRLKEEAAREKARLLREAERRAADVAERSRKDADAAYTATVEAARSAVASEKQRIVKGGQAEADKLRAKAKGPDFQKAVDLLVKNFETRIGVGK